LDALPYPQDQDRLPLAIQVSAGSVTVTEAAPSSASATVTVKASGAPGDTSQKVIVTCAAGATAVAGGVGGSSVAATKAQLRSARPMRLHGRVYLVVRIVSTNGTAEIRLIELNKRGEKVPAFTRTVATNRSVRLATPLTKQVRVAYARLVS
jgi:hypothetical protein